MKNRDFVLTIGTCAIALAVIVFALAACSGRQSVKPVKALPVHGVGMFDSQNR